MIPAQQLDKLERLLQQISGKNDLSQSSDEDVGLDAQHALYECEILASEALDLLYRIKADQTRRNSEGLRRVLFAKTGAGA